MFFSLSLLPLSLKSILKYIFFKNEIMMNLAKFSLEIIKKNPLVSFIVHPDVMECVGR